MRHVWLSGVGIFGPGLDGWEQARAVLREEHPYVPAPVKIPAPTILPPRDRRRCSDTVALALYVAQQTVLTAGLDPAATPSVFANSAGDGQVMHRLLSGLAKPDKPVSPTDFHNSVLNAPAFYWALGVGCHAASTSIAAARYSFAAALLKAAMHSLAEETAVLMVCFDNPLLPPLNGTYPLSAPLGVGLALWPRPVSTALAELELCWRHSVDVDAMAQRPLLMPLVEVWAGNPAGCALPLLETIARQTDPTLCLPAAHDAVLEVSVRCP